MRRRELFYRRRGIAIIVYDTFDLARLPSAAVPDASTQCGEAATSISSVDQEGVGGGSMVRSVGEAGMHRSETEGRFGEAEPEGRASVCAEPF